MGAISSFESKMEKKQHRSLSKQLCCNKLFQDIILKLYNVIRKNNLYIRILVFSILSATIMSYIGCSKENIADHFKEEQSIYIKDGRLIFKDLDTFKKHADWIGQNQMDTEIIHNKNSSFGFKSMAEIYYEGMELIEDHEAFLDYVELYPNVYHPIEFDNSILYELESCIIVGYIANKEGLIQIGDRIIRITYDYNYEIQDGDESKIELLLKPKDQIRGEDIVVKKTLHKVTYTKGQYSYLTDYFSKNSKYRIVGRLWEYSGPAGWTYDIETNAQKKTLGMWFGSRLTVESSNEAGYFKYNSGDDPVEFPANSKRATHTSRYSFIWNLAWWQIDFDYSYCPAKHYGTSSKYGTATINRSDAI